jgi:hypothetical protein
MPLRTMPGARVRLCIGDSNLHNAGKTGVVPEHPMVVEDASHKLPGADGLTCRQPRPRGAGSSLCRGVPGCSGMGTGSPLAMSSIFLYPI